MPSAERRQPLADHTKHKAIASLGDADAADDDDDEALNLSGLTKSHLYDVDWSGLPVVVVVVVCWSSQRLASLFSAVAERQKLNFSLNVIFQSQSTGATRLCLCLANAGELKKNRTPALHVVCVAPVVVLVVVVVVVVVVPVNVI